MSGFKQSYYSYIIHGVYLMVDNILFSEHFSHDCPYRTWSFRNMSVWNDHLDDLKYLSMQERLGSIFSNHGFVKSTFTFNPAKG